MKTAGIVSFESADILGMIRPDEIALATLECGEHGSTLTLVLRGGGVQRLEGPGRNLRAIYDHIKRATTEDLELLSSGSISPPSPGS